MARQPIAVRKLSERMSNGDSNTVTISIKNANNFIVDLVIIDELPFQFQERDFSIKKQTLLVVPLSKYVREKVEKRMHFSLSIFKVKIKKSCTEIALQT